MSLFDAEYRQVGAISEGATDPHVAKQRIVAEKSPLDQGRLAYDQKIESGCMTRTRRSGGVVRGSVKRWLGTSVAGQTLRPSVGVSAGCGMLQTHDP
jgi:hypothetical protein